MYLDYYNLKEQPFGVTPDPSYLYYSPTHREALASLVHGVLSGRAFMVLIAKPGMGKTTILFQLLQWLNSSAKTVFLFQNQQTPRDFLRSLLLDLSIEDDGGDLVRMYSKLNEALLRASGLGKRFVVVIDEAQSLETPVLELVRILSNFETSREKMMQIVLAGQPQLAATLASPKLVQLRQRISIFAHLDPFTPQEAKDYINHRLRMAGYDFKAPLFTDRALALMAEHHEGIPRNINNVCFNALSAGCALRQKTIDRDVVAETLNDLNLESIVSATNASPSHGVQRSSYALTPHQRIAQKPASSNWMLRFALAGGLVLSITRPIADADGGTARRVFGDVSATKVAAAPAPAPPSVVPAAPTSANKLAATTPDSAPYTASAPLSARSGPQAAVQDESTTRGPAAVRPTRRETIYKECVQAYGKCDDATLMKIYELNPWLSEPMNLHPGREIVLPLAARASTIVRTQAAPAPSPQLSQASKP